tara:strand:+ start:78341 stop:79336 length:996 start_codon:yes stop_codon:yes gene_type:complete
LKILVTGSAGFIGFHLVNKLLSENYEVIGIDNLNTYYDTKLKIDRLKKSGIKYKSNKIKFKFRNYTFYKCDIVDNDNLKLIFKNEKPSLVCNLAAQAGVRYSLTNPNAYIKSNIVGFQNVIDCCKNFKINNFLYASSSSVYGANRKLPFSTKDTTDSPISLYGATKKSNELVAHSYSHLYNMKTVGLRFFTVYGPWGRPDMALFLFVKALINNEKIKVFNKGNMLRDFTYIDDIVEGIFSIIKNPIKNQCKIYNIGNNKPVNLLDFVNVIEKCLDKKFKIEFEDIQLGDVKDTYADVSDLFKDFKFKPKTNIQFGVRKFIDWYLNYYKVKK